MRTLIRLAVATLALAAFAGSAAAQVAAPNLHPVPFPNLFRPANPAVVAWREASFVGLTVGQGKVEDSSQAVNPQSDAGLGDVNQIDLALVGGNFGLAVSRLKLKLTDNPLVGTNIFNADQTNLGLGMRLGDMFAIGAGQEQWKQVQGGTTKETLPLVGLSVRLAEVFYLGAAMGTKSTESGAVSYDQGVVRYGLAAVLGQKETRVHAEWYHETMDSYSDTTIGLFADGTEMDGLTLEATINSIFLGYEQRDEDALDATTGALVGQKVLKTISVGWLPEKGLSVSVFDLAWTDPTNTPFKLSMQGVNVGWAF